MDTVRTTKRVMGKMGRVPSASLKLFALFGLAAELATFSGGILAQAQIPVESGSVLQSMPGQPTRQDSILNLEDRIQRSRAVSDVEGLKLEIKEFRFNGLTLVPAGEMQEALKSFIGPDKKFQDLLDAATTTKKLLAERGYFLADAVIPEQKISDGVVEILVLEGRLGKVKLQIDDDVTIDRELVLSYAAQLVEGTPVSAALVERALFLIGDLRGISSRSSFEPGAKIGTADLTIKVSRVKSMNANVDYDVNGSVYTGTQRLSAGADFNNLIGRGDLLSVRTSNAVDGDLRYWRTSLLVPVGSWGTKMGGAYTELKYQLGTPLFSPLHANGSAYVTSLIAVHPFQRSRNSNLLGILQYDERRFQDTQATAGFEIRKMTNVASVGLSGDFRDTVLGGGVNIFNATHTTGSLDFATDAMRDTDKAGRQTQGQYRKLNVSYSRLQSVAEKAAFYFAYTQQLATKNLDSSEKVSLGGPSGVRAYPQGEGAGDEGYVANMELRLRLPNNIISGMDDLPGNLVFTMFYDFGKSTINLRPLPDDTQLTRRVSGYGIGLNWEVTNDWLLRGSVAMPNTSKAQADHLKRTPHVYFQFSKYF